MNDHINIELNRLSNSGSLLPSQQLQRFTLENRDRKLFFGQPLTIRKYNKLYIPSFEFNFLNWREVLIQLINYSINFIEEF